MADRAGGPLVRDRAFFYATWVRQRVPKGGFATATVPTLSMREGDLSQLGTTIVDPLTGQPFANNRIPAERINPLSRRALDLYYPVPNRGGPDELSNNFDFVHPYPTEYMFVGDWPSVRIDYKVNESNSLYGRFLQRYTPYVLAGGLPDFLWTRLRDHRQYAVEDTHILSPTMLNTLRVGLSTNFMVDGRETDGRQPINGVDAIAALGLQGATPVGYSASGFPSMWTTGLTGLSTVTGGVKSDDSDWSLEDSMTWSVGRHVWKFGGEFRTFRAAWDVSDWLPIFGSFSFDGRFTGFAYGDFLLGLPGESSRVPAPLLNRTVKQNELGLFVTDTFKLSSKLTLDLGVRWDRYGSPRYTDGLMYNWDPTTGNVIAQDPARISPLYPDTITVVPGDVVPKADNGNIRPRVSAAYRLDDRTVLRGGYGQFTERIWYFDRAQSGGPYEIAETYRNVIQNGQPLFAFPNPFPDDLSRAEVPSQSVSGYPMETDEGTIHQFNATLEREFRNIGMRLSYIGSRSRGQNYAININKPEPSLTPFTESLRPYPQFVEASVRRNDGRARFNSVQIAAQKRAGWFQFDAHYTWSSNWNNYLDWLSLENPNELRWARDVDTRVHYAVVSTNWLLPVGRGQRYLSNVSPTIDKLASGWSLHTISYFSSGTFFTPTFGGADPSNTGTFYGVADALRDGNLDGDERTYDQWFDPSAYAVPAPGRFGNAEINSLKGQGLNVHHLSVVKRVPLPANVSFTAGLTISNLFNSPHFYNPSGDITSSSVARFQSVIGDYFPEKQGRRMIMLKGRLEW